MNHYNKLRSLLEGASNLKPTQAMVALIRRRELKADKDRKAALQDEIRAEREKNRKK